VAFDFPANPTAGDVFTDAVTGLTYSFTGVIWAHGSGTAAANPYVLKSGDAMLGYLSLVGPPTSALHATTKQYTDELVAAESLFQGVWDVAANTPDLDPAVILPLHNYSWTAQTADPAIPELAPANLPGIGGKVIAATDTVIWNANLSIYEHVRGAISVSQMVIADVPPATAFHGQNWWDSDSGKMYVYYDDGTSQQWCQLSGGGGATKAEVFFGDLPPDPTFSGELWWDTSTGNMMINMNGTFVQTNVEEAPLDGQAYARSNAGWVASAVAGADFLPLAGGTMTGKIWLQEAGLRITSGAAGVTQSVAFCRNSDDVKPYGEIKANWTGFVSNGLEATMEFWVGVGGYGYQKAFNTTIASPPGINVNGTMSANVVVDRSLPLDDPDLAAFVTGEGDERGVDLGQVVKHLLAEIAALKAAR
jgi:hypothetical protein